MKFLKRVVYIFIITFICFNINGCIRTIDDPTVISIEVDEVTVPSLNYVGEEVNLNGILLKIYYSDDTSTAIPLTKSMMLFDFELFNYAGTYSIQVKYAELFAYFYITVSDKPIDNVSYTLTFDTNGGNLIDTYIVHFNENIQLPTPTKDGFTFEGWYLNNQVLKEPFSYSYTANITIEARWIEGEFSYYEFIEEIYILEYLGELTSLNFPEAIKGKPVTRINWDALTNNNLKTITLPKYFEGFIYVNQTYGYQKHNYISTLENIHVVDTNPHFGSINGVLYTQNMEEIVKFPDSKNLESYTLPNSINNINTNSFANSVYLKNIFIPNTIESIGAYSFYNSSIENFNIAENSQLTHIEAFAFSESKINMMFIPKTITTIDAKAFLNAKLLKDIIFEENSQLSKIEENTFSGASSLSKITIPNSIVEIEVQAFYYTSSLNNVYFEENSQLVTIGNHAFQNSNLHSLVIPNSVENIGNFAFAQNQSLISVIYEENSQLTKIEENVFRDAISLTSITIPKSIIEIGSFAFYNATSLGELIFEDDSQLNLIDAHAFNRANLVTLIIPKSVDSINSSAFKDNRSLVTLLFQDDSQLNYIGASAFTDAKIQTISIPNSVKVIGESAFANIYNLKEVEINEDSSLEEIKALAFDSTQVSSIFISKKIKLIENYAFPNIATYILDPLNDNFVIENGVLFNHDKTILLKYPASKIETTYTIPNTVIKVGNGAFSSCINLTDILFEEGSNLEIIGDYGFSNNINLKSLIIPSHITKIGDYAFANSIKYQLNTLPSSLEQIGIYAFFGVKFDTLIIPSSITSIDGSSFYQVENFIVDQENLFYSSEDGVLYNKDKTELIRYPIGKLDSSFTFPATVTKIANSCFSGAKLTSITIPSNITVIGESSFHNTSLEIVTIQRSVDQGLTTLGFNGFGQIFTNSNLRILVPNDSVSAYKAANYWYAYREHIFSYDHIF